MILVGSYVAGNPRVLSEGSLPLLALALLVWFGGCLVLAGYHKVSRQTSRGSGDHLLEGSEAGSNLPS